MMAAATLNDQTIPQLFDTLAKAIRPVADAFNQMSLTLNNLVTAGIAGTQEASRLGIAWMMLTRQIASVFIPIIDALTHSMRSLTTFFGSLTGDGQRVAMIFGVIAAVTPILVRAFSLLSGVFSPIYMALGVVIEALYQFFIKTDEGKAIMSAIALVMEKATPIFRFFRDAFVVLVDALVVGFQAIMRAGMFMAIKMVELAEFIASKLPGIQADAMKMAFHALGLMWKRQLDEMIAQGWGAKAGAGGGGDARKDVSPSNFRFEAIGAAMERITLAANKSDDVNRIAKEQLAAQQQALPLLGGILQATQRQLPAIGK